MSTGKEISAFKLKMEQQSRSSLKFMQRDFFQHTVTNGFKVITELLLILLDMSEKSDTPIKLDVVIYIMIKINMKI